MTGSEPEYQKLPGKGRQKRRPFGFAKLYLGKDHLLCLYNSAYTEDYRRFYFKDIQAIVVAKNSRRDRLSATYGVAALLSLLLAFLLGGNWAVFFMILAFLLLINIGHNAYQGATCTCRLYTAVSQEELPSLGRLKNAQKALDIIRPLIEASQGKLSPEETRTKFER